MAGLVPILGVCLGHQIIGYAWKAQVVKGKRPMHGKSLLSRPAKKLFQKLPKQFQVTRYHSLVVSPESLPDCLEVDAKSDDGAIMALSHRSLPVYGVQFHPEAVLTEYGHELLNNFITLCEEWRNARENFWYKKLPFYKKTSDLFQLYAQNPQAIFLDSSLAK